MDKPNVKAIPRDIFDHAEVIRPMLHLEGDGLCWLQHLHIHLLCCFILHIHQVILERKRRKGIVTREETRKI